MKNFGLDRSGLDLENNFRKGVCEHVEYIIISKIKSLHYTENHKFEELLC